MRVIKAYRNLNAPMVDGRKSIEWSIKPKYGNSKGKVECYADAVILGTAKFVVQPAGAERVKARQQREVIAWVEGEPLGVNVVRNRLNGGYLFDYADMEIANMMLDDSPNCVRVTYRALMGDKYFRDADTGEEITGAEFVVLFGDGSCYALGVTYK